MRRLAVLFIATASVATLGFAPAAQATVMPASVSWEDPVPNPMTAGGTASQDIVIMNRSTAGESITLSPLRFVPSCGSTDITPCATPELGVFSVDSPATGPAGMCNEDTFPVVADDTMPATGRVGLDPDPDLMLVAQDPPVPPNYFGEACTIHIALHVLRVPTYDSDTGMAGVQTRQGLQYKINGGSSTFGHAYQVTVNPDPAAPVDPGLMTPVVPGPATPTATGQRAAALKKCQKKKPGRARRNCKRKANLLPV